MASVKGTKGYEGPKGNEGKEWRRRRIARRDRPPLYLYLEESGRFGALWLSLIKDRTSTFVVDMSATIMTSLCYYDGVTRKNDLGRILSKQKPQVTPGYPRPLQRKGRKEVQDEEDDTTKEDDDERCFVGYLSLVQEAEWQDAENIHWDHDAVMITVDMDRTIRDLDDDETIICMDGEDIFTARQKMSSPEVFTAYKRVDRKVKPVPAVFPEDAKVTRRIPQDPLESLEPLPMRPPVFKPDGGRLTQERLDAMELNPTGFLWPEELNLFHLILQRHQNHFVFEDSQRGSFREDYFSPYIIPVVPHVPWAFANIPIPPGIRERVIALLREKMEAGVYEPSQSSYRSRWFCVLKKNGKLRIVHDLQPLNKVTIRDAGLPPNLDNFVEPFAGHQCYTVFDLYWGFDARKVDPKSRDLTAFMTPLGLLRITSLPTGFTNSPAEFQACMSFILQPEIPHIADIFIDDLPIKGPKSLYEDKDGKPGTLKENPGIRRFIWEHANDVYRIIHRVGHAGGTFSPSKVQLAQPEVLIVGQRCTPTGRLPDEQKVEKILKWPTLKTVKDVRAFLGLCGTVRIWIENYSLKTRPLTELVRHDAEFIWDERRQAAFDTLKLALVSPPALRPIDYSSRNEVILSVDSSYIAVGFILSQIDKGKRRPARYGSIPMNEREARYSQPKLELYGLFRALRAYRLYLIGVKYLTVEVDAKYIKGMLNDPDLQPNATINRWIQGILLFDFQLVHVPAEKHKGPDALSRREKAEDEEVEEEDDSWLDEIALYAARSSTTPDRVCSTFAAIDCSKDASNPKALVATTLSQQDQTMTDIYIFLKTFVTPKFKTQQQKQRFISKALKFYLDEAKDVMWKRKGPHGPVKCIFHPGKRAALLEAAHEGLGHRGEYAVMALLKGRFYWPSLWNDVRHHIRSCHECQIQSIRKAQQPPIISTPSSLFVKIYVDVMFMPEAYGYRYIVAARDDLSGAAEGRALKHATAEALAKFFWEEIICRYGAVGQVTTDNGAEVQGAFKLLMERYSIPHVTISPYNSQANGVVERGHFNIRQSLIKACKGRISEWPSHVSHAFFADKVTVRRATGFSPYYLLFGQQPALPLDFMEASFLVEGFTRNMSTIDLLALRIRQLQRRPEDIAAAAKTLRKSRLASKEQFERRFRHRIRKEAYPPGALVLVRNTEDEKSLDRKDKPRYLGPYEVVRRTRNGAYVLKELDGTLWRQAVAAFRIIPYVTRSDEYLREVFEKLAPDSDDDEDTSDEEHDWMLTDSGEEVGASDSDYDDNSEYDSSDD